MIIFISNYYFISQCVFDSLEQIDIDTFLLKIADIYFNLTNNLLMTNSVYREEEEAEEQRILEEQIAKEKEARKEGVRNRKPVFTVKEKTEEELKGYSRLNKKTNASGSSIKAVSSKVSLCSINYGKIFSI